MLPVTVVTGFLGAGKTTVVNRWLGEVARGDVAVIVNELGAVGIDGELLAARTNALVEIAGGCVCCRTQGELVRALARLAEREPRPSRVLVETSGAASPIGVLRAIAAGGEGGTFVLDGVVTVVDATRVEALGAHDLAIEQIGCADVVVLSRADRCDAPTLAEAARAIAETNGAAHVVTASSGELAAHVSFAALLDAARAGFAPSVPARARRPSAHVYESIALGLEGEVDGERFADFMESELSRFAGRLFRTKGIVAVAGIDERMIVQGVADLVDVGFGDAWGGAPRTSRLVVVGYGLDRGALEAAFRRCAAAPSTRGAT